MLPTFKWELDANGTKLIIDFHDGGDPDVVVLTRVHSEFGDDQKDEEDDECILVGHLAAAPEAAITVDGCPGNDTFQVNQNHYYISFLIL